MQVQVLEPQVKQTGALEGAVRKRPFMRWYGYLALVSLVMSQYMMFRRIEPFHTYFTPIQWWNYIFLIDAIVSARQGRSMITSRPAEFGVMLVLSNVLWLLFEWYNFALNNWYYINLSPDFWKRILAYFVSFASIYPGIFLTSDLLETFGVWKPRNPRPRKLSDAFLIGSLAGGAACVVFPLIFPSPYVFGLVWIGFFFLLEPINYWMGYSSVYRDIEQGSYQRFWLLLTAGAICGLLWEFWNFWAKAKWIYTVPFTQNIKYFEMPLLGFFGFPPFALECFAMYHFARGIMSRRNV